jgi:hypothetical protein
MEMNYIVLSVFFVSLFLSSCSGSHSGSDPVTQPVETRTFISDNNGSIQYYTNDQTKMDCGHYNIYSSSFVSPMSTVEIKLKKVSGSTSGGYGIVFCSADPNNYYRILAVTSGYYQITKKVAGTYSLLVDWTHTSWWIDGHNVNNTIKVTKSGADSFDFYVNNNLVTTVTDTTFDDGAAGFYAWASVSENFPATPLDVRFQMMQPVPIP